MIRLVMLVGVLLLLAFTPISCEREGIKVGSKKFTESVTLGEMLRLLIEEAGEPATHYPELGGTKLVFQALLNGDIDLYPEYTGTITEEILSIEPSATNEEIRTALRERGVAMSESLGFNNTYVLGMRKARAAELGITAISDLARHPDLVMGFGNEFLDRQDGWQNLKAHYGLPQRDVTGLDHDLAYRQLELGAIDVIDAYATDAKIEVYDLLLLEDDLEYFPRYDAVVLYREDLAERFPAAVDAIDRLAGQIADREMVSLNAAVEMEQTPERVAAAAFLNDQLGVAVVADEETFVTRLLQRTIEHLDLVRKSLLPAILIAIPLGVIAAKRPHFGQVVLSIVGIVQTIPSLALLVMLMPLIAALGMASVGLGSITAVTALLLYSLLPIVRNTHAGLRGVAGEYQEAGESLGLPPTFRLMHIELPLASRSILAGIKTAAVLNIGFATLGALIGAGGYGQPILTGIRLSNTNLILEGAIPAALLALLVQTAFELSERIFVPRGLRLVRDS